MFFVNDNYSKESFIHCIELKSYIYLNNVKFCFKNKVAQLEKLNHVSMSTIYPLTLMSCLFLNPEATLQKLLNLVGIPSLSGLHPTPRWNIDNKLLCFPTPKFAPISWFVF